MNHSFFTRLLLAVVSLACAGVACAQSPWIAGSRDGNEARFLYANRIVRYDLVAKTWLTSFVLPRSTASAMAADASGGVVAYGTSVYRYGTGFTGETLVGTVSSAVQSVFLDGNLVIVVHSPGYYGQVTIFNRMTGAQISTKETYSNSLNGSSHAPAGNRIYGRTSGGSPSDIVTCGYTDAGVVGGVADSPYHGAYPSATRTWCFPDEARVVDSSGTVYTAPGLNYFGSFAGSITDIAFNGNVPVVLRGGELIAFSANLLETGRAAVGVTTGAALEVTASEAFVFSPGTTYPLVKVVALSTLNARQPGTPVNPDGLAFTVDDAFPDKNGNLLLFSKSQQSLFRWSAVSREYTGSFPLLGSPKFAAYSVENDSAYFAYETQEVRRMDLSVAAPKEIPFLNLPNVPNGLATAGSFVFASDPSGAWDTHSIFSAAGSLSHSLDWNYYSRVWEWDPVKRRMYFFRDDSSPNDLHYETIDATGKITGKGETPYHGNFTVAPPIRTSRDGGKVVIGSGVVFETVGLTRLTTLPNGFVDAFWRSGELLTIRAAGNQTQIQRWNDTTFAAIGTLPLFDGKPLRLLELGSGELSLVTLVSGVPRIYLLNADLSVAFTYISQPPVPTDATEDVQFAWTPSFRWPALGTGPLTFSAPVLPRWLNFQNGTFSGTPRESDSGDQVIRSKNHRVVLRATNGQGQWEEREISLPVAWQNDAPQWDADLPALLANGRGDPLQVDLGALVSDPDGRDTQHWTVTVSSDARIFSELRLSAAGVLDISYAPYVSGSANLEATVTDASGASATTLFQVSLPALPKPAVSASPALVFNRATGLYDQKVVVKNVAGRAIAGFKLEVTGLGKDVKLRNGIKAVNGGGTYLYNKPVATGKSVTVVLQYFAKRRGTAKLPKIRCSILEPVRKPTGGGEGGTGGGTGGGTVGGTGSVTLGSVNTFSSGTDPAVAAQWISSSGSGRETGALPEQPFAIRGFRKLPGEAPVIEFQTEPGREYRVQYCDDLVRWKSCPEIITHSEAVSKWIDSGPPFTDRPPSDVSSRFYRVERLPIQQPSRTRR